MTKERYQNLLEKVNQYNSGEIGITRIAFSNEEQACTHGFIRMCKDQHLEVRLDASGNLIARRPGKNPSLPPVVMGSHLDTVYQGGKYDGAVGVTAALEVITRLNEKRIETDHPIEIISFACEESSRFGVSTIGSKAMAGLIEKDKIRHLKDRNGTSIDKAFSDCALDFESIDQANRTKERFKVFLELHIEQGPVLENKNKKIGIVTGIAAPIRLLVTINGKASHSGTTPMHMRKDALLAASELALETEASAKMEQKEGTVATVGDLIVHPGAMNVVPGKVEMKIDIRGIDVKSRDRVLKRIEEKISGIKKKRDLNVESKIISREQPVMLSTDILNELKAECEAKRLSYELLQSGAGHDAMHMTKLGSVGLIFIPSKDGVSHHPDEYTALDDILAGIDVLEAAVLKQAIVHKEGKSVNEPV
ncbi:Zn-dependent hydrolase [Bacillus gobiensis]|uniref:Zn-dependent hydrolase n=1 Tax=Bacillus gobiensis TaxID=1441095 RepID=UPI003D1C8FE4